MKELKVEIIFAKSLQAKGRVERFNGTLQDRLIKALRREGISNIAEANKYLHEFFISDFNKRFAVNTESDDLDRPTEGYKLQKIFSYKTFRQVGNDYTINLNSGYIQLQKGKSPLPKPKQYVTIGKWLDKTIHIYFNEQEIDFTELKDKPEEKAYKVKPPKDHPWRNWNIGKGKKRRSIWKADTFEITSVKLRPP